MPRLDRPARSFVIFDRWAVMERLRALASHLIEAPPLSVSFISPLPRELTGVEMRPSLTVIMDPFAKRKVGSPQFVSVRKRLERQVMDYGGGQIFHIERASGQINHGCVWNGLRDAHRACRVGKRCRNASISSAVPDGYRRKGVADGLMNELFNRLRAAGVRTVTTGFFRPEYFYAYGFRIEKRYAGLVKSLDPEPAAQ